MLLPSEIKLVQERVVLVVMSNLWIPREISLSSYIVHLLSLDEDFFFVLLDILSVILLSRSMFKLIFISEYVFLLFLIVLMMHFGGREGS